MYYRDKPNMIQPPMAKNIILIMGESLSASNVGTFGYERQTMPFLDQLVKNAPAETLLKPAYSAGLGTAISLPDFLMQFLVQMV